MNNQELIIKKINFIIYELLMSKNYSNNNAAKHFVSLRRRLQERKKLTKKMRENLEWIEKSVQEIK